MSIFVPAFVIAFVLIFVFGIFAHIRSVQSEKWDQTVSELRVLHKEARRKFISYMILILSCPISIPILGAVMGREIRVVTVLVIFLEVCFSILVLSQGHRMLLISRAIYKMDTSADPSKLDV